MKDSQKQVAVFVPGLTKSDATKFDDILGRLKYATGTKSDTSLAKVLGVGQSSISSAKERQKLPPSWLVNASASYNISVDWLISGEGLMWRSEKTLAAGGTGLGERIRRARGARPLGELADALGVSLETLEAYESGEVKPDSNFIRKLSVETNFNIDWINRGEGYPKGGDNPGASLVESGCPGCAVKEQALRKAYDDLREANKTIRTLSAQVTKLSLALIEPNARADPDEKEDEGSSRSVA